MPAFYLSLPIIFLRFWFLEAPVSITQFFLSVNQSFLQLFSLSVLLKTFFKPIKNEYRKGLVGFSIAMGMGVKTMFIVASMIMLAILLVFEAFIFLIFITLPFLTFYILFI